MYPRALQILVTAWFLTTSAPAQTVPEQSPLVPTSGAEANPPWGQMESYTIQLQVPPHLLRLMTMPSRITTWNFPDHSPEQVEELFIRSGLPDESIDTLFAKDRWVRDPDGVRVFPPSKLIGTMEAGPRSVIYQTLSLYPKNRFHYRPFIIQSEALRDLVIADENLDEHLLEIIDRLSYTRGKFQLFADLPYLMEFLTSSDQQRAILRALTTTPSLVLQLRLSEDTNIDQLFNYWTANGLNTDARPLLESLTRENTIEVLDVANLLPPTPRRYLNTFPSAEDGLDGRYPDAFWSSINFFNFTPVDIYFNHSDSDTYLRKHFQQAPTPLRFGDLLLLVRGSDRKVLHACVYIADNIVYTKNGSDLFRPWVFMKLEDMLAYHEPGQKMTLVNWRRIPPAPRAPASEARYGPQTPIIAP